MNHKDVSHSIKKTLRLSIYSISTIHGSTIHVSTIHGSDIHVSTIHGSIIHGSTIHWSDIHVSTIHGSDIHVSAIHVSQLDKCFWQEIIFIKKYWHFLNKYIKLNNISYLILNFPYSYLFMINTLLSVSRKHVFRIFSYQYSWGVCFKWYNFMTCFHIVVC